MQITGQHYELIKDLRARLVPWKRFIVAIEGPANSGKSNLARLLAWQLEISVLEIDCFLDASATSLRAREQPQPAYDHYMFERLVNVRLRKQVPLIIEGTRAKTALEKIGVHADYTVVIATGDDMRASQASRAPDFVIHAHGAAWPPAL